MSIRTPNFVTTEEYKLYKDYKSEPVILPPGTFVRPIDRRYLPNHILDSREFQYMSEHEVWVYCHYGIIKIPQRIMRKT